MQPFKIAIMAICLFCMIGGAVLTSEAATSFTGSTVVGIDQAKRTVTFQTKEGDTWTLPVSDPNLLNKDQVAKDPDGIGFANVLFENPGVKSLALAQNDEGPYVEPTQENAWRRTYPLTRYSTVFVNRRPGQPVDTKMTARIPAAAAPRPPSGSCARPRACRSRSRQPRADPRPPAWCAR